MAKKAKVTTDHEEIRRWAEERGARPVMVRGTGSEEEAGILRIDFPGYSGEESLEPISWDDWFKKFDDSNLALIYQETTAGGERSNFNKLIGRETAEARQHGDTRASRRHPERSKASKRVAGPSSGKRGSSKVTELSRRAEPAKRQRGSEATKTSRRGGRTPKGKAA